MLMNYDEEAKIIAAYINANTKHDLNVTPENLSGDTPFKVALNGQSDFQAEMQAFVQNMRDQVICSAPVQVFPLEHEGKKVYSVLLPLGTIADFQFHDEEVCTISLRSFVGLLNSFYDEEFVNALSQNRTIN